MNFDFSDDEKVIKAEARRFLEDRYPISTIHRLMDAGAPFDDKTWREIADLGWLGIAVSERYGGLDLGYAALCAVAEELGRALCPLPFLPSMYLAAEAIRLAGDDAQKNAYLPQLAAGEQIGTVAVDKIWPSIAGSVLPRYRAGGLNGHMPVVAEGSRADFIVVPGMDETESVGLFVVDLRKGGIERCAIKTIDDSRPHARITFHGADAQRLGAAGAGTTLAGALLTRAAVFVAFEQVGGAAKCLEMAKAYALGRYAFNRPIGSFQAIKHKLADMYVQIELARSNAYYGAMALESDAPDLALAAACARVSGIAAYEFAASENIQVHGGAGYTWEADCHLHFRRSRMLALNLGPLHLWQDQLFVGLAAQAS